MYDVQPPGGSEKKQTLMAGAAVSSSRDGPAAGDIKDEYLSSVQLGKFLLCICRWIKIHRLLHCTEGLTTACDYYWLVTSTNCSWEMRVVLTYRTDIYAGSFSYKHFKYATKGQCNLHKPPITPIVNSFVWSVVTLLHCSHILSLHWI